MYLRLDVPGINANPDDMWVEVQDDFYNRHSPGDQVGILVGNYDVFLATAKFSADSNRKLVSRKFEKSAWSIEEVYESLEEAKAANPAKAFSMPLVLKEKRVSKNGAYYFLCDSEGKTVKAVVTKDIFDKYQKNQTLTGEFESLGDYVRFIKLQT